MSNKYQRGKIYAIRSYQTDDIYIGSTVQFLYMRMATHRRNYKLWKENRYHYTTSFEIMKYDDAYIEEIEKCPCNDKNELNRREGQLIREMKCVNKRIEGRTKKEYEIDNKEYIKQKKKKKYLMNKEKIKKRSKAYYEKNKEKIKEKEKREKITCICGSYYRKRDKSQHLKTIKHQTYIQSQSN
jgi:hypothetical protein